MGDLKGIVQKVCDDEVISMKQVDIQVVLGEQEKNQDW